MGRHKVYLKVAREPVDTSTAMGKQFFYMLISYAEWERNVIRERTMSGRLKRAQEGKHLTKPPFGYTLGQTSGQRVIVTEEADVVREIFRQYLAGMGDRLICTWLNNQGITTKHGYTWHPNTVKHLLTNSLYAGTVRFGHKAPSNSHGNARRPRKSDAFLVEVDSAAPPIISRDVFDSAQSIRGASALKMAGRAVTSPHLLTGILRCKCGASVQFKQISNKARDKNGDKFEYYLCSKKFALGARGCSTGFLPVADVDAMVVKEFMERFGDPSTRMLRLEEMLSGDLTARKKFLHERFQALHNERQRLATGLGRLDTDYLAGELPARRYDMLKAQSEQVLEKVTADIRQVMAEQERQTVHSDHQNALAARLDQLDHWTTLTVPEQKQLLNVFLESIIVYRPLRDPGWECELRWRTDISSSHLVRIESKAGA